MSVGAFETQSMAILQEQLECGTPYRHRLFFFLILRVFGCDLPYLAAVLHFHPVEVLNVLRHARQKFEPGAGHVLTMLLPQAAGNEPANSKQQQDDQGDDRQTKWTSH